MKKFLTLLLYSTLSYGIGVPVVDTAVLAKDTATMVQYSGTIASTISKITSGMTVVDQLKNVKTLNDASNISGNICQLCSKSDIQQLQQYSNNINSELCGQFSTAYSNIKGVTSAITSLGQIMTLLTTDPKAAMIALQQATIASQQTTNNTLAQMQLMQAQVVQKQLADEKKRDQANTNLFTSMKQDGSGL